MNLSPISLEQSNKWTIHSYYTLNPWAPDGSDRILLSGADLDQKTGEVFIVNSKGKILDRFGHGLVTNSFWHTGFWQSWSKDGRYVYFQSGTLREPMVIRRELSSGKEVEISGDLEGMPLSGEPGISTLHGLLYAAGYGDGVYKPNEAAIPFQERTQHGLFQIDFSPVRQKLAMSTNEIYNLHPHKEKIQEADAAIRDRLGENEGLTLMTYCVRWNPEGDRFLFYFGNHCVSSSRKEPKITYVFTSDRHLKNIHLAVDCSFERRGVHWGWHPDGEHLVGYGSIEGNTSRIAMHQVKYDGSNYKMISRHRSGGHPSICPAEHNLLVTDEGGIPGRIVFIDIENDVEVAHFSPGRVYGKTEPRGRSPQRICHHPIFSTDGTHVLYNTLKNKHAQVEVMDIRPILQKMKNKEHLKNSYHVLVQLSRWWKKFPWT